jgi:hypothetical protein
MALLDTNPLAQLLGQEQMQKAENQALSMGALNALAQLLAASGAQARPVGTGQAIGQALLGGVGGYQSSMDRTLNDMLKTAQISELAKKQKQSAEIEALKKGAISPVINVAPSMTSQDAVTRQLMQENMLMGDTGLESLSRSGNYAVQGTPMAVTPSISQELDLDKLRKSLMSAGYIEEAKKYAPEYLTVGDSVYAKDITGGLKPVIDNAGKLTGEFGNYAKLIYGTDKVANLPKGASDIIIERVNKGQALTGGIPMGVGKEGSNIIDKELIDIGTNRMMFTQAQQKARPEFFQTPFQVNMKFIKEKEKLKQPLTEQESRDLADYTAFTQTGMQSLNAYINKITGAAMGAGDEEKRLRSAMPDPQKDSYTEFMSKTNNILQQGKLIEARYAYVKKNGLKFESVPVTSMPAIMRAREAAIIKELNLDPNKQADYEAVKARLAQEFGLLQ